MNSASAQQSADYERFYLDKLDRECPQVVNCLDGIKNGVSVEQAASIAKYLDAWQEYLQTFEPLSQYLLNAGFPRLCHRLSEIRADLDGARKVVAAMYKNLLASQAEIAHIQEQADRDCLRMIQETNERTRQVLEECLIMRARSF